MNKIINKFQSQINNPDPQNWRIKCEDGKWYVGTFEHVTKKLLCSKIYETLSAFSGFIDKTGKYIYVCDIVEYIDKFDNNKSIGVVSYDDLNNTIPIIKQAVRLKNGEWTLVGSIPLEYTKNIKIVGNIWDNIEILLKE